MARHRDVRNMDYSDDYDGYDDVYGHSVDDDYFISPSNKAFLYNRETSHSLSNEQGIIEEDENLAEEAKLSDLDKAKLESVLEEIRKILGSTNFTRNDIVQAILQNDFSIEKSTDALLQKKNDLTLNFKDKIVEKDDKPILINLNNSTINAQNGPNGSKFVIPKFGLNSGPKNSFTIPKLNMSQKSSPNIPKISFRPTENSILDNGVLNTGNNSCENEKNILEREQNFSKREKQNFKRETNILEKSNSSLGTSLNSLITNHLSKTTLAKTNFPPTPSPFKSKSTTLIEKNCEKITAKISNLEINEIKLKPNSWHIDLSNALKDTNFQPLKKATLKKKVEKFQVPFFELPDSDNLLNCSLDISYVLKQKIKNKKRPSRLGQAICCNLKWPSSVPYSKIRPKNVLNTGRKFKVFDFATLSPDEQIRKKLYR